MARPSGDQWKPLGLTVDPVPGDSGRISQEAAHLATVARQITDQVAALRKIGPAAPTPHSRASTRTRSTPPPATWPTSSTR